MTLEFIVLFSYFLFLFGLLVAANNIPRIAAHPAAEALTEKIRYNLRDIPRVDYSELSSEEEVDENESQSDTSLDNAYAGTAEILADVRKRHRDPVAMSRLLESLD